MRGAATLGAAALGVAALLAPFTAPADAGAGHHMGGGMGHHESRATRHDVAVARSATRGFQHTPAARAGGYALFKDVQGIACISMRGMGAMGVHYVDGALVDGKIQLRHPEALVYRFTTNGHLRLAALEYLVTRQAWRVDHPTGRPALFGHRFNLTPKGNRFGLPAFFSLHAWVWHPNPMGRFTMWNPRVHCPQGI
ncbi:MAG TPA: hypothetical protein VHW64_07665 [Nocardioides sp.]|uniref:hypothetical protein n=1 Tax=Nocardioides sp. TaxID=35761 RepID=UPI002E2EB9FA|nr:hypothetical protein [Nocardioides sp.]HEX3930564.1 hypothetical protein [Nocardioides sp.]